MAGAHHFWRITRYNPSERGLDGAFESITWTDISDVGRSYDGKALSLDEYEEVERAYLEAVRAFAADSGVKALEVRNLEMAEQSGLADGEELGIDESLAVVKANLRGEGSCQLANQENDFFVHVGLDLYLYIGSSMPCELAVAATEQGHLFVEPNIASPQLQGNA